MERKRAVVAIVENNGNIILGKKRSDSTSIIKGEWHIPGETVEENETDEEAVVRGIREETGISVEVIKFIGTHQSSKNTSVNWYLCKTDTTDLIVGSDLEDVKWVAISDVYDSNGEIARSLWPQEVQEMFKFV